MKAIYYVLAGFNVVVFMITPNVWSALGFACFAFCAATYKK